MARRLIVPPELLGQAQADLPAELAHYVGRVLRLSPGTSLMLYDGQGGVAEAELVAVDKRSARVEIGAVDRQARSGPQLELLQAIGKGDKMDQVVRQATELGVGRVVPVLTERAVARHDKRIERWRNIADDAVRVAGHRYRPEIERVGTLPEALDSARGGLRLVLALDGAVPLSAALAAADPKLGVSLLIGPEGGLTADEVEQAQAAGFVAVHLGPHTLRTETAGPAAAAILMFWAGGLGGSA